MNATAANPDTEQLRLGCQGVAPLSARLEGWQLELCAQPSKLAQWLERYGSPLNVLDLSPMARNAAELEQVAAGHELDFKVFFARKANKALTLVDEAKRLGLGVDLASERELSQTLDRGVHPRDLMMTAAVKPLGLLTLCVESGTTVAIDNEDELQQLASVAESMQTVPVALRLAPALSDGRPETRFGFDLHDALAAVDGHWATALRARLEIVGVHFHLDGYDARERVTALAECLELVDALREHGHQPKFVDIGGGIPMSYVDSAEEWATFWSEHHKALLGQRESLTFEGHPLGLVAHGAQITGRANVYPCHQTPIRGQWLEDVLTAPIKAGGADTVADAIRERGLQLRCEPGRSLLDGCGLTAARVEFRKQRRDGAWMIGVAMNRTQCRSTADDFLVDPLLLRPQTVQGPDTTGGPDAIEGYLVGAYCIERELLTWRRMRFARGVQIGDIVIFPNSAGYLMHILESSSHQMPLARNLIIRPGRTPFTDPIDVPASLHTQ